MGNYYTDDGLDIPYWFTLWVSHTSPSDLTQDASPSKSIWVNKFLAFIKISVKASFTVTPTVVITTTNIYRSEATCILIFLPWLVGIHINLTGGIFTTGTDLSSSILSFVNINTVRWSDPYDTIAEDAYKETSVDEFSTSLSLHGYVALLHHGRISHYHIILYIRCHIANCYCKNSSHHMCTTWGTLASDSNIFCIPLQSYSTLNSATHKYLLNFTMDHLTVAGSPKKLCLEFCSGETVEINMKEIGCRRIPYR